MKGISVELLLVLLGEACDLLLESTERFTNVLDSLALVPAEYPSFTLCLAGSTTDFGFSFGYLHPDFAYLSVDFTIQYPPNRSASDLQQTIWITEIFELQVLTSLTLRNVRISGQRLIWTDCEEDWCTHCLVPPYIWPGEVDFTVIDGHPPAQESDPFYERSQCYFQTFNFMTCYEGSRVTIEGCTLDNIRLHNQSFISLLSVASLTIVNTLITRMDFSYSFLNGNAQEVLFSRLTVSGFNRDHAYGSGYGQGYFYDSGFFFLSGSDVLLLENSVFEDNILLGDPSMYYWFFYDSFLMLRFFKDVTIRSCQFRSSMQGIDFLDGDPGIQPTILISNCSFEDNFAGSSPLLHIGYQGLINYTLESSRFVNNTARSTDLVMLYSFDWQSSLVVTNVQIMDNSVSYSDYRDAYVFSLGGFYHILMENCTFIGNRRTDSSRSNLVTELIASGLLNESPELISAFLGPSDSLCKHMLGLDNCANATLRNVEIKQSLSCNSALSTSPSSQYVHFLLFENVSFDSVATGLDLYDGPTDESYVFVNRCHFQRLSKMAIIMGDSSIMPVNLYIDKSVFEDCGFRGCISFFGTRLEIRESKLEKSPGPGRAVQYTIERTFKREVPYEAAVIISESKFAGNVAGDILISSSVTTPGLELNISHSDFSGFGQGSIFLDNSVFKSALIHSSRFSSGQADPGSGIIKTNYISGILELDKVSFSHHNINSSYVIQIQAAGFGSDYQSKYVRLNEVNISDSVFAAGVRLEGESWKTKLFTSQCRFMRNEGLAIWSFMGIVNDTNSVFENNTARSYSCYQLEQFSDVSFTGTQFERNGAQFASLIYLRGPKSSAYFSHCRFEGNMEQILTIEMSLLVDITDSLFANNSAQYSSLISISNDKLTFTISNSVFLSNQATYGVLNISDSGNIHLSNVSFIENSSNFMLVKSSLQAQNCSFAHISGPSYCVAAASLMSTLTIIDSQMSDIRCPQGLIWADTGSVVVLTNNSYVDIASNSSVIGSIGGHIEASALRVDKTSSNVAFLYAERSNLTVRNSIFSATIGPLFASHNSLLFALSNSSISYVTQPTSGQVSLISCSETQLVELKNVSMVPRASRVGITLKDAVTVTIDYSEFRAFQSANNSAIWIQAGNVSVSNSVFTQNRALDINTQGGAIWLAATSALLVNCSFSYNAAYSGGAIFWTLTSPQIINSSFTHNLAFYGPDTASQPHHLFLLNSSLTLASGQQFADTLLIAVLDLKGQLVQTESSRGLLAGSGLSGNLEATVTQGLLHFTGFVVTGTPGQSIDVQVLSVATALTISINLRPCKPGEVLYSANTCLPCSESTYSVHANATSCTQCPSSGVCPGDGHLYPHSSYWRPSESYNGLLKCYTEEACTGHENYTSETGMCSALYEGNMCQSCAPGTSRKGPDKCVSCASDTVNYLFITFAIIAVIGIIVVLIRSTLKSNRATNFGIHLKILLNYAQVTVLIVRCRFNWPDNLLTFFSIHEFSGNTGEKDISLECITSDVFFKKSVAMAILPILLLGIMAGVWGLVWGVWKLRRKPLRIRGKFLCSLIVSLFYFYPQIVSIGLSAFSCETLRPGEHWLRVEMAIRCWDRDHSALALAVSLPSVLLWGLGVPLFALLLLVKYRKRLYEVEVTSIAGFLIKGYKPRFFFWEIIVISRKICISGLYVALNTLNASTQVLTLVFFLCIVALLQFYCSPFQKPVHNRSEMLSLCAVVVTAYSGLYFSFSQLSVWAETLLIVLVYFANSLFLLKLVKAIVQPRIKRLITRILKIATVAFPTRQLNEQRKRLYLGKMFKQSRLLNS